MHPVKFNVVIPPDWSIRWMDVTPCRERFFWLIFSHLLLDISNLLHIKMYNGIIRGSCIEPNGGGSGRSRHLVVCGSKIQSRRDDTNSKASKFSLLHSLALCRRANRWHVREKMLLVAHRFSSLPRFEKQCRVFLPCKNE